MISSTYKPTSDKGYYVNYDHRLSMSDISLHCVSGQVGRPGAGPESAFYQCISNIA